VPSLTGQFLIASDHLGDPNFHQTVVLIVQHTNDGAMGIVVNRPTPTTITEAWEKITGGKCSIHGVMHIGGPCEGMVSVLHTDVNAGDLIVLDDLFFSADKDSIEQIISTPPEECRFFIGYAGWGPGQLESELGRGDWYILPGRRDFAFAPQDSLWMTLRKKHAGLSVLSAMKIKHLPNDPTMN